MDVPKEQYGQALLEQLREQVSNLMAAAQLLTPAIREHPDRRYDQYLAILNQSLYRLLRMMYSVESIQRLEDGTLRASMHPVTLDLAGLCRDLALQVAPLAWLSQVSFHYEAERDSLLAVGDPALLQQMLLQLISNAIRAAGTGGEAGLKLATGKDRAVLTVWNGGSSLPDADPGQTYPGPLEKRNGLGVGVDLARGIAVLHGGALVFDRREAPGARAVVSLPTGTPSAVGTLRSPQMGFDPTGGFSRALVELSSVLPYSAFLPEDVE